MTRTLLRDRALQGAAAAECPADYARWCGPAAVASYLGITRTEAARALESVQARSKRSTRTTWVQGISRLLWVEHQRPLQWFGPGNLPTLAAWLREGEGATGEYIVLAAHHFMHTRDGKVIEANGYLPHRGRVLAFIPLPRS